MQKIDLKKALVGSISLVIGIASILLMLVPLVQFPYGVLINGFSSLEFELPLGIYVDLDWYVIMVGTLSIIQIVISAIAILLPILYLCLPKNHTLKNAVLAFDILCSIFSIVYMVEGIIFKVLLEYWEYESAYTLAYINLIVMAIINVVLIIVDFVMKNKKKNELSLQNDYANQMFVCEFNNKEMVMHNFKQTQAINYESKLIEAQNLYQVLKDFKMLLDENIITKEEYDYKKGQMLENIK